jgi:hypothetical protein
MSLKVEVRPVPMGNQRTPGTRSVITCDGVVLSPEEEAAAREAVRALRSPAPTAAEPDHLAMVNDMDVVPEDTESIRCRCEWLHPVDGSVDARWPAELDPACPVHATEVDKHCASCGHTWTEDTVWCPECRRKRERSEDVRRADVGADEFDLVDGLIKAARAYEAGGYRVEDERPLLEARKDMLVRLRAALRSPEPAAEPVAWGVHAPNTDFLFVTAEYDLVRPYVEPPGHHYIVPLYTRSSSAEPATGRDRSQGVTEQELASAGGEPNYTLDEAMDALYDAEREYGASLVGSLSDIFVARLRSGGATTETGEES